LADGILNTTTNKKNLSSSYRSKGLARLLTTASDEADGIAIGIGIGIGAGIGIGIGIDD